MLALHCTTAISRTGEVRPLLSMPCALTSLVFLSLSGLTSTAHVTVSGPHIACHKVVYALFLANVLTAFS